MIKRFSLAGYAIHIECHDTLAAAADWLASSLAKVCEARGPAFLLGGARIQVGWTMFSVRRDGDEYHVCELNFDADPFADVRGDLTVSLGVLMWQRQLLQSVGADGVDASFQDKVVLFPGCLETRKLYLEHCEPSPGDSGWYIGPYTERDEKPPENGTFDSLYLYELLHRRPSLLRVTSLPPGFLVVCDGDSIEAVVDERGQRVYRARA